MAGSAVAPPHDFFHWLASGRLMPHARRSVGQKAGIWAGRLAPQRAADRRSGWRAATSGGGTRVDPTLLFSVTGEWSRRDGAGEWQTEAGRMRKWLHAAPRWGVGKEWWSAMFSPFACCGIGALPPSAFDAAPAHVFVYPQLQQAIVWTFALVLLTAALGVLQEAVRRSAPRGHVRRRLQAVWYAGVHPRAVTPLGRGVGGTPSRVPPRLAAGSPLPLRLASVRRRKG